MGYAPVSKRCQGRAVTSARLEELNDWVDGPPVVEQLEVVGSYNLFGAVALAGKA